MSSIDAPALLGFAVGITGTLAAFGAKYARAGTCSASTPSSTSVAGS